MLIRCAEGSAVVRSEGPVVCIAGGPSLTQQQVDFVRGKARVIAINDAYLLCPWADVLYFPDHKWWRWHKDKPAFKDFAGQKCCTDLSNVGDASVHKLRYVREWAWSDDPTALARGEHGHAGLQAIQMAALAGGDTILLLGYDAREPKGNEKTHFFGDHPTPSPRNVFGKYRRSYAAAEHEIKARGLRIINCTPNSAIESFPKMTLEEAFAACAEPAAA